MKNAKKFVSCILILCAMTGLFSGCEKSSNSDNVTLSVGDWPIDSSSFYQIYQARKEKFEADNPGIKIKPDNWAFTVDSFYPKAASGQLPNLYTTNFTEVSRIISDGYSSGLKSALENAGYYDKINPELLKLVTKDNDIYCYPYNAYTLGVAYNVELFEKAGLMNADGTPIAPSTWEELVETAVKIKEKTGVPGFVFPLSNNCGGWMFSCLAWSYGVEFMKEENGKWISSFDTDECVKALEFVKDMKWKYDILPEATNIDFDEMYKLYCTGRGAMLMSGGDIAAQVYKNEMNIENVGFFPMPAGPKKHVTLLGGKVYSLSDNSSAEQINAALEWFKYTGDSPILTEETKKAKIDYFENRKKKGIIIGIANMSCWNENSEVYKYEMDKLAEYRNTNENHYILYNKSLNDPTIELKAEESVCCQELYSILDNCLQEVITNKDADCKTIIKEANKSFQVNYLDKYAY